jgi:hypothetical protein
MDASSGRQMARAESTPLVRSEQTLSAEQLDHEFRLQSRGESDGRKDRPSADAQHLSEAEAAVVARIHGALAQKSKELLGVGSIEEFRSLPDDLETLAGEPQTILTQFRGRKARAQSAAQIHLNHAQADFERANSGYQLFRQRHQLTHSEPRYDDIFWRKVFWLALLFIIEVSANGWVIGQASPGGLVQGWTTALLISILVVMTGTLIGAGPWRYLTYNGDDGRGHLHRFWAVPALVLGVMALTFFALYVAHYRSALADAPLNAPVPDHILSSIGRAPLAPFEQLQSLLLFVIAMLIGVFSIVRGATWDDPYPGYGPRHRRVIDARQRTQEFALALSHEVDAAKEAADQEMARVAASSQDAIGAARRALAKAQDNAARWDAAAATILDIGRDAIEIYRDANRSTRRAAEPVYFEEDPFDDVTVESSASMIAALESAISRSTAGITQCKSQLAGARAQLEAEYHSFYDDELSPFLRGIAETAATNVKSEFDPLQPPEPGRRRPAQQAQELEASEDEAGADQQERDVVRLSRKGRGRR